MKKCTFSVAFIFSAAFLVSCGNESESTTTTINTDSAQNTTTAAAAPISENDRQFMMEAASGSMMEIEAGRLAEQQASNPQVKAFGAMVVRDHSQASNELRALASSRNVMLTDSMIAKHREHLDMMRTKTGRDFDKAYMSMMVDAHNEDVNKFQVASTNGQDTAVRGFATRTLPVLRMHLDSARAINTNMR